MITLRPKAIGVVALACGLLAGCERPPVETVQRGYRGTGMLEVYNPRLLAEDAPLNAVPNPEPAAPAGGPKASEVYKNVKVLGDLSVGEFTRLMVAMTNWVSPKEGCGYCHNLQNLADDSAYTKVVSRRMLQMTQHVNNDWKRHVGNTGVTCYTCHRGHPQPQEVWFTTLEPERNAADYSLGNDAGQNRPAPQVGLSSLPYDPFTPFLLASDPIRVVGPTALPTGNRRSIKETEWTYAQMMHFSQSLGVNCTYCHNSRSFASWEGPQQRVNAWYGIRMVRDLNGNYLKPLTGTFPRKELGPAGDVAKINCNTCHQGAYKPLYGASMLKDYPALGAASKGGAAAAGPPAGAVVAAAPAAARGTVGVAPVASGAAALATAPAAAPDPAPAMPVVTAAITQSPSAPAATAPVPGAVLGRVLFRVDRTDIGADGRATIERVATAMKNDAALKVDLSGFADRSGKVDRNLELAKERAFAVREALKAAGVGEDRIALRKPEFAIGKLDPASRRVDLIATR
jgi:photosynthetic reaction center cytochrome c subunit